MERCSSQPIELLLGWWTKIRAKSPEPRHAWEHAHLEHAHLEHALEHAHLPQTRGVVHDAPSVLIHPSEHLCQLPTVFVRTPQ
jgi:hypothetical protein